MQDEDVRGVFFAVRTLQDNVSERQERDERHVVRDEHGADERDVDKGDSRKAQIFRERDDFLCADVEEFYLFQRAYDGERAKQAGYGSVVDVGEVFSVRRHDERGDEREDCGDSEDGIALHEGSDR